MASKTTRRSTTTVTDSGSRSSQSTPKSGSKSPGRMRPPSPTMISRVQEKQELAGLNDRLAAYIDRVRFLEGENAQLSTQVRATEETIQREVTNIKALYERELSDARRLLDETAKEKARLQIEVGKYKTEADEWKDKYHRAARELEKSEKKLLAAEGQVNDLQARLNDAVNQRKHWENEYHKVKGELDKLEKMLANAKKQLEDETVARVDFENRYQSLKEELAFKNQVHAEELNETRTRTEIHLEEVDGRIQKEYESKLSDALSQMREENDYRIRTTREETEEVFEMKLAELRELADRNDGSAAYAREELRKSRIRVDELSGELSKLRGENATFKSRIQELEDQLRRQEEEFTSSLAARDAEIRRLRLALEDQLVEYRDLLDIKIALDMEIAAYRNLLVSEETRLNITSPGEPTPGSSAKRGGTPGRGTPVRSTPAGSRKRKRVTVTETSELGSSSLGGSSFASGALSQLSEAQSSSGYTASSSAKGSVEINETDAAGTYIKLYNTSDKSQGLGGWQLKHSVGEDSSTYKFHRSVNIKPGAYITVWSMDAGQTHSPPSDLVMKGQKWFTGDNMTSVLISNDGEEMASREMTRSLMRTTYVRSSTSSDDFDSGFEGDPRRQDEKCSIM